MYARRTQELPLTVSPYSVVSRRFGRGSVTVWVIVVLMLVLLVLVYGYSVLRISTRSEQVALMLSTILRDEIEYLREPDYYPKHAALKSDSRAARASFPFISLGTGMPGGCNQFVPSHCLSFGVSDEIEKHPELVRNLTAVLQQPCDLLNVSGKRVAEALAKRGDVKAQARKSDDEGRLAVLLISRERELRELNHYFGCESKDRAGRTILLNVMAGIDRAGSSDDQRFRIVRQIKTQTL